MTSETLSDGLLRRRHLLVAGSTLALSSLELAGAAHAQTAKPLPVRIGYIGDFNGSSLVAVANKLGLWAKHGLAAELKAFTNGPLQVQALGAKDLDFGYIGPGALWLPITGRAKVIAVGNVGFADRVIGQPGIKTLADLKGKTVAVPEGTSGDMLLRLALQKAKLQPTDIKRLTMDPATIVTAFGSGQVDAASLWYPLIGTIKKRLPALTELFSSKELYPAYTFPTAYIARNDVVEGDPRLVEAMTRVIKEALDWRAANLKEAVALTAALLKAPAEVLEDEVALCRYPTSEELSRLTRDGTVGGWLKGMNTLFKDMGRVPEVVSPDSYYLGARFADTKI
ncbi:aliphatic sulfonate ABC transporter substrate-binding protein [Ideonella livida]|uniref:Aliphatic sulfonate ABC transporter substrate-binding protein n=1 Tax=Ideonella livida TaxID=2707176 RepID=A0A7C9TN24_9BURK|nr:aliphatic sulfonate ABC transporter substrate-binding protein [Ideonella livida]NDY93802.1 aliphatic sulfonate ABC transporter substrate-binding protein [Ideonella livida]